MALETINASYIIGLGFTPEEADIKIFPATITGLTGEHNAETLRKLGLTPIGAPDRQHLEVHGYARVKTKKSKDLIFIVTHDGERPMDILLQENLYKVLIEYSKEIRDKTIWIPLNMSPEQLTNLDTSYNLIAKTINRFTTDRPVNAHFVISIPDTPPGKAFFESPELYIPTEFSEALSFVRNLSSRFFLLRETDTPAYLPARQQLVSRLHHRETDRENIDWEMGAGDIIFLKDKYTVEPGKIRITAFGQVVRDRNSEEYAIAWRKWDLEILVSSPSLIKEDFICKLEPVEVANILTRIPSKDWQYLYPDSAPTLIEGQVKSPPRYGKIPRLHSDSEKGTDYLNISRDVTAFARVIASKNFEPPLAIALFGKWGSGKSFFMRKLKDDITALSTKNPHNMYCTGIAHIHFNAWSYMDANLWASFVSRIFEGLHQYITENSWGKLATKEIEEQLSTTLHMAKEEISTLSEKKGEVERKINELKARQTALKSEVEKKIGQIREQTAWDVLANADKEFKAKEKIKAVLNENDSFIKTEDDLRKVIPEKYWDDPEEAHRQLQSGLTFLKAFFNTGKIWKNILWLVLILAVIIFTPVILKELIRSLREASFVIPQAVLSVLLLIGAGWRRAEQVWKKLQPLLASFWKIKEEYEQKKEEALAKFNQAEKALKLQLEKNKEELLLINEQMHQAELMKKDLEFRMKHAIATETLYTFIEKRSSSDDYKKHLGIISIIRKDFEILNALFTEHHEELINAKDIEAFRKRFRQPLQRIVLYIDDLDRCPEDNVVQVLEAVNLLMAFPLFIVVVGVDPRWVKNSLIKKYALQFTGKMNASDGENSIIDVIEPANYLEKIFQVPFHLKEAPEQNVREMIKQLAAKAEGPEQKQEPDQGTEYKQWPLAYLPEQKEDSLLEGKRNEAEVPMYPLSETAMMPAGADQHSTRTVDQTPIELLELDDSEISLMQDMSDIIGSNPRAIKRFVNIYKIIKAHEDHSATISGDTEKLRAVLFLLALSVGQFRRLLPGFEFFMENKSIHDRVTGAYFKYDYKVEHHFDDKQLLGVKLHNQASLKPVLDMKPEFFLEQHAFLKRFTFKNL